MVLAARDENILIGQLPALAGDSLQLHGRTGEWVESPESGDGAGNFSGSIGLGQGYRCRRRRGLWSVGGGSGQDLSLVRGRIERQAATIGVRHQRNVDLRPGTIDVKNQVMGKRG